MHQREAGGQKNRVNHVGYLCEAHEKILLVIDILLRDKPDSSIVFCNSSECVDFVRKYLQRCGFIAPATRAQRSVVVASDETMRGERKRYSCVINFDVPFAVRNYTARMDMLARNNGRCISLLCDYYSDFAPPIIARYRLQCGWPAADFSNYSLPERSTVQDWLGERESGKQAPHKRREGNERKHPARKQERDEWEKKTRRGRGTSKRAKPSLNYASKKADQIVADKSQRKSIWERILSFLTR